MKRNTWVMGANEILWPGVMANSRVMRVKPYNKLLTSFRRLNTLLCLFGGRRLDVGRVRSRRGALEVAIGENERANVQEAEDEREQHDDDAAPELGIGDSVTRGI